MRFISFSLALVFLWGVESAFGQACSGYPAGKTWQAGGPNMIHESDGGSYPGWIKEDVFWASYYYQDHPVTVDAVLAQRDRLQPRYTGWFLDLSYTTDGSAWTMSGGGRLSLTWTLHVSDPGTHEPSIETEYPQIHIGNGAEKIGLSYQENVTDVPGCTLSGWVMTDGMITAGGRAIPNRLAPAERYLPMAASQWHTIRVDLNADGTFDVWLDGGGSDWQHVSGATETSGDLYIRFGVTEGSVETHEFSTACVAWGEGDGEIPTRPTATEEICDNDDVDDDGDGDADCADTDCDCSYLPVDEVCNMFIDVVETFDEAFVPDPVTGDYSEIPADWIRSGDNYVSPAYTDQEAGSYKLEGKSLRWRIAMDDIPVVCGADPDTCFMGTFTIEQAASADELALLPIDWSKPVILAADTYGNDLTTGGQWEPFVWFEGYTGTRTSYEWGNDDGLPKADSKIGFTTVMYELNPGQGAAAGTKVRVGVDFDFRTASYEVDKSDIAFFENVRIIYHYDPTVPILQLSASEFSHSVLCESPPDDTLMIINEGGGALTYMVTDDADWLSVTPESGGPLSNLETDHITIAYDAELLSFGQNIATMTISSSEAWKSPMTVLVSVELAVLPPDYDCDGDVDQEDFGVLQSCFTGDLGVASAGLCASYADFDGDGDVDQEDVMAFEDCATGPELAFDPGCLSVP